MAPSGWTYYKEITVSDTNVDANLTNFPLLVVITADSDIGTRCDADGHCLRFTVSPHGDSELLDYERQSWSGGGGSAATGKFWVEVPSILASGGVTVRCWYDNNAAADGANITGTWNSDFKAVYHLEESSNPYLDATSNSHDSSAGTYPTRGTGRVDYGQDFTAGSTEYINVPHSTDFRMTGDATVSLWINLTSYSANNQDSMFSKMGPSGSDREWQFDARSNYDGNAWYFNVGIWTTGGPWMQAQEGSATRSLSTWYHGSFRFDQAADELYVYANGVQVASDTSVSGTQNVSGTYVQQIGIREGTNKPLDGILDEIRYSAVDRGVAWLKFEYYNMTSTYEHSWGAEVSEGGVAYIPKIIMIN